MDYIETLYIDGADVVVDAIVNGNNVTWVITNISAGTTAVIAVKAQANAVGIKVNNETIIYPDGSSDKVNATIEVQPLVDVSVDKRSDDGEGEYQRPFREFGIWCEPNREGYCGYPSRAGVRTEISRRTRLTPDTALLSESSGWNRVFSCTPVPLWARVCIFLFSWSNSRRSQNYLRGELSIEVQHF